MSTIDNMVRHLKHPDVTKTIWHSLGGNSDQVNAALSGLDKEANELLATGWRIISVQMHGGNKHSNSLILYVLMKDGESIDEKS